MPLSLARALSRGLDRSSRRTDRKKESLRYNHPEYEHKKKGADVIMKGYSWELKHGGGWGNRMRLIWTTKDDEDEERKGRSTKGGVERE